MRYKNIILNESANSESELLCALEYEKGYEGNDTVKLTALFSNFGHEVIIDEVTENLVNVRCGDITFNAAGIVLLKAIYNILTINVKAAVFIGVHIDAEEWFKDENGNAYNEDVVGWGEFIANLNY